MHLQMVEQSSTAKEMPEVPGVDRVQEVRICADNHIEICWDEGRLCPLCEKMDEIQKLEREIEVIREA